VEFPEDVLLADKGRCSLFALYQEAEIGAVTNLPAKFLQASVTASFRQSLTKRRHREPYSAPPFSFERKKLKIFI